MNRKTITTFCKAAVVVAILAQMPVSLNAQVATLDQCQQAAERNYPLVRRYALIEQTQEASVERIGRGWMPQIQLTGQATLQNRVVTLPDALTDMMARQGVEVRGLSKGQYRIGADVSQNIYDGGRVRGQQEVVRRQGDVERAENEVGLYQVRQRVNELYFGLLLVDERISHNEILQELLRANEEKLQSMYDHGTASLYDLNTVKAERIGVRQQLSELRVQRHSLAMTLSAFTGMTVEEVVKPAAIDAAQLQGRRPELLLADQRITLADAQERVLRSNRLPMVSVFASGYYGYPGYDMYHDMFSRNWTLNGMVGLRVSWNLGWLWTDKSDRRRISLQRSMAENQRETFLFNNHIEQIQRNDEMEKYRRLMDDDAEVLELRTQMRRAAESKLGHGIIAVKDLVRDITDESAARTQLSIHEISLLKAMYDLKYAVGE